MLLKLRLWGSYERSRESSNLEADLVCSERVRVEVGVPSPAMIREVRVWDLCLCSVPPRLPGSGEGDGDLRVALVPLSSGLPPMLPDIRLTKLGDSRPALCCPKVSLEFLLWMEGEAGGGWMTSAAGSDVVLCRLKRGEEVTAP